MEAKSPQSKKEQNFVGFFERLKEAPKKTYKIAIFAADLQRTARPASNNNNMRKLANSELDRKDLQAFKNSNKTPLIIILDNIRSLHNIGSVFRTSDAFLIEKIFLCGITATPPNKEIHKTALGATETVDWEYATSTAEIVQHLKTQQINVLAVEQTEQAIMLNDFMPQKNQKYALVFGNEVKGVQQEVVNCCDGVIEIPQIGSKHSLNISVAAGILIWDFFQKMGAH
jgi:tRNA G18 (ribose-2'-O)-methylase SpoU